jgi:hypothetical protein
MRYSLQQSLAHFLFESAILEVREKSAAIYTAISTNASELLYLQEFAKVWGRPKKLGTAPSVVIALSRARVILVDVKTWDKNAAKPICLEEFS